MSVDGSAVFSNHNFFTLMNYHFKLCKTGFKA
jgi:hypothetical protein